MKNFLTIFVFFTSVLFDSLLQEFAEIEVGHFPFKKFFIVVEIIMKTLPLGVQDFGDLITQNCVYVDKTRQIAVMIDEGKYFFLSRPRRFGKSRLVSIRIEGMPLLAKSLHHDLEQGGNNPLCRPLSE